jgi:hypothetical protein
MDEMERAHRNDYEYEKKLREARAALRKVIDSERMRPSRAAIIDDAVALLSEEMDHIVARWN